MTGSSSGGGSGAAGPYCFEVVGHTRAPIADVWSLLSQAERWKEWTWMTRTSLIKPGSPDREGVGALRRFAVGPFGSVEEVVEWEPPHHLGYVARKGLPVRSYRADVRLEAEGEGTKVTWSGHLVPKIAGTGTGVLAYVRFLVAGFTRRLCAYAEVSRG